MNDDTIAFAYSLTEHAIFSLKTMTTVEITLPATTTTTGMGAFSGLAGYMTLGLGAKAKPSLLTIKESEVLIVKDSESRRGWSYCDSDIVKDIGHFLNTDGSPSRPERIDWPAPPEETGRGSILVAFFSHLTDTLSAFIDPYVFVVLPPGTVPSEQTDGVTPSFVPSSVVQVRSSISLANVQTVPFPPLPPGATPAASNYSIRLLTSSPSSKSPLYMIRSPIDRATATAQGSAIWRVYMKSWGEQIDELVVAGSYLDALSLLDTLDAAVVPDKVDKRFVSASPTLTSHRLSVVPSSGPCMQFRYSRTGSTMRRSTSSLNSIPTQHTLFHCIQSPLPAGFLPLRRIGLSYLAARGRRFLSSKSQNLRKR